MYVFYAAILLFLNNSLLQEKKTNIVLEVTVSIKQNTFFDFESNLSMLRQTGTLAAFSQRNQAALDS